MAFVASQRAALPSPHTPLRARSFRRVRLCLRKEEGATCSESRGLCIQPGAARRVTERMPLGLSKIRLRIRTGRAVQCAAHETTGHRRQNSSLVEHPPRESTKHNLVSSETGTRLKKSPNIHILWDSQVRSSHLAPLEPRMACRGRSSQSSALKATES